jgi:hypothetical protein
MAHSAGAGGVAANCLHRPLELALTGSRVATRRALVLLDVIGRAPASTAQLQPNFVALFVKRVISGLFSIFINVFSFMC